MEITLSKVQVPYPLGLDFKTWQKVADLIDHPVDQPIDLIGEGTQGEVYQLDSQRALKLTIDEVEVKIANFLVNKPSNVTYKVHQVFGIKTKDDFLYGIVMDLLLPLPGIWKTFLLKYALLLNELEISKRSVLGLEKLIVEEGEYDLYKDQIEWLHQLAAFLEKHKIKFMDLHDGNVMMTKSGNPVALDFGQSSVPPPGAKLPDLRIGAGFRTGNLLLAEKMVELAYRYAILTDD